jgi:hypothetical protein
LDSNNAFSCFIYFKKASTAQQMYHAKRKRSETGFTLLLDLLTDTVLSHQLTEREQLEYFVAFSIAITRFELVCDFDYQQVRRLILL